MSHHLQTDVTVTESTTTTTIGARASVLRRLYSVRFAFAAVWAGAFVVAGSTLTPVSVALLVLYPLFDLAAAVVDFRSSGASRPRGPLYVNMVLSLLTAVALAVAASSAIPDVLRVWGVWAIAAGVVQVVVAVRRNRLRGQKVLVLSGSISVIAGAGFILMAAGSDASLISLAGYATLGGIFFLVSAIRLHRAAESDR
jgi:uncharacterized membrane protein HdeD (DUF308 family)